MAHEHDDAPVPDRELEAWREADTVDTEAFDDNFFDTLARDIELAAASPTADVIPLRSRRPLLIAGAAIAAALLIGLGLLLRDPPGADAEPTPVAATEEPTPSIEDLARAVGASAIAAVLDGADEDETASLLASRGWITEEDDDVLPSTYGSLLEQLDDLEDYDSFFPL